jgi:hypothetical protein
VSRAGFSTGKIPLLFGELENGAQGRLDVLQAPSSESARKRDFVQPLLYVVGPHILDPNGCAARFQVDFPNVPICLECRWALVLFDPGEIDHLYKIPELDHFFRLASRTVDRGQNHPRLFGHNGGRNLAARGHFPELLADSHALHFAVDHAAFVEAHIPASVSLEDLAGLFTISLHPFPLSVWFLPVSLLGLLRPTLRFGRARLY